MIGFSGLSRPSGRRLNRMSGHFEENGIMLLNLLNACVIEGKALPENLATLLGILSPVSVTSAFMASLWPQCFSTKVDL